MQWVWDEPDYRFLDGESIGARKVGFTSYPRSGNSFLRRYCEQITSLTTGSSIHTHTSTSLQIMGLKGEGHIGDNAWIVKSHHPFEIKLSEKFTSGKTFICVRHPLDVFPSFAALCNTISHGNKTDFEFYRDYPEYWNWFVTKQAKLMQDFF